MALAPDMSELRAANAKIAAGYDQVPYDASAIAGIDPAYVFAIAALYGAGPARADYDVLDLGCGGGTTLARVGAMTSGRVVGTDLTRSACDRAEARCKSFGARARIVCADVLDLEAADLGQFDLIYNIGVLYVTPPDVRRRILELIAACLKPNGIAVISYYFGAQPLVMGGVQQMLRLAVDGSAPPEKQIEEARRRIEQLIAGFTRVGGDQNFILSVLHQTLAREDSILFHELLNHSFAAVATSALETALAPQGVHFLNWIAPGPLAALASPRERALMADSLDLAAGAYHYAVFGKCAAGEAAAPRAPALRWQTRLKRTGRVNGDKPVFGDPELGITVDAAARTAAALDKLADGPKRWAELAPPDAGNLEQEFRLFWQHGLATPTWEPLP